MKKIVIFCSILLFTSTIGLANNFTLSSSPTDKFSLTKDYPFTLSLPDSLKIEFAVTKSPDKKCISKSKKKDWLFTALAGTHLTLSLLDIHSTFRFLNEGHEEANFLWSKLIQNQPGLVITAKLGVSCLATHILNKINKKDKVLSYITLGAIILAQGYVVIHNYKLANSKS